MRKLLEKRVMRQSYITNQNKGVLASRLDGVTPNVMVDITTTTRDYPVNEILGNCLQDSR